MPKKRGQKKNINGDFTINDCANAPKPVTRVKKATPEAAAPELAWDEVQVDDLDIVEEVTPDGTKNFVYKKKKNNSKSESDVDVRPGVEYPEIIWYLISDYIKPEQISTFACINRATYAITKRESFWRTLYKRYCEDHPRLPKRLHIDNSFRQYGLQQRVIRALYHTYDVFIRKGIKEERETRPHSLIKRRCVNVWYCKGPGYWSVFFKLKKSYPRVRNETEYDFIEELGRIDVNPDEHTQVLEVKVTTRSVINIPPLMGMTLSTVSIVLAQGFRHYRLQLGFHSSQHCTQRLVPEQTVLLDRVLTMRVLDWWHPSYPHYDNTLRRDEEATLRVSTDLFLRGDL